jgi:hypothetical protein
MAFNYQPFEDMVPKRKLSFRNMRVMNRQPGFLGLLHRFESAGREGGVKTPFPIRGEKLRLADRSPIEFVPGLAYSCPAQQRSLAALLGEAAGARKEAKETK